MKSVNLAIFASGTGTNAVSIIRHFESNTNVNIAFILSNKITAPIVERAKSFDKKVIICSNEEVEEQHFLVDLCLKHEIDYIILAGFLRKIPTNLIHAYPEKIINIHPSLLPKFGGAGMYGKHVHQAVKEANEEETGISIHFVSEEFDSGRIIAQYATVLSSSDTADMIQEKVHKLEQQYFAITIEHEILKNGRGNS
jgi:phosphoribosylglycinamide formyltransferase-1